MITLEQKRIIQTMASGVRLCRHYGDDETEYFFSDASKPPRVDSVRKLQQMGVIAPAQDGLLEDHSQTFDLIFIPDEAK